VTTASPRVLPSGRCDLVQRYLCRRRRRLYWAGQQHDPNACYPQPR